MDIDNKVTFVSILNLYDDCLFWYFFKHAHHNLKYRLAILCLEIFYHLLISCLLFTYILTTVWFLQQFWSVDNDKTNTQMSSTTNKFSYSIRSLLLIFHLQ